MGVVDLTLARVYGDDTTKLVSALLQQICLQVPHNGSKDHLHLNAKYILKCRNGRLKVIEDIRRDGVEGHAIPSLEKRGQ